MDQASYPIKVLTGIAIGFNKNKDQLISLYTTDGATKKIIDTYEVGDGIPEVNTLFFHSLNNKKILSP